MCRVEAAKISSELLAAVRGSVGLPALTAYETLADKGVCLAHFCSTVHALSRDGSLRSSDPSQPLEAGLAPRKILELGLEADPVAAPGEGAPAAGQVRLLPQGFRIFLDQPLGKGSFGVVYLGEQIRLQRPVAIKILRLSALPHDVPRDWFVDRFRREPSIIARLNHPHIVQVIDCGEEGEELWYAMEFLKGGTLSNRIRREGRLPPAEVKTYFRAMADALNEASNYGILHRDVKPGNVFNSGPKLADFGLAKVPPERGQGGVPGATTPKAAMVGSPPYVAPERANFQAGDLRSDIYSLGATMYHAATGHLLFDLDPSDRKQWYHHHLHVDPRPVTDLVKEFPVNLAQIIHRCLRKNPNDRYRSFESLLEQLRR